MIRFTILFLLLLLLLPFQQIVAQDDPFREPQFEKVTTEDRAEFQRRFRETNWSGAGFSGPVVIDHIPTSEIRARLQKVFGEPTQKLKHLVNRENFRPGHYIQFEYWFVINDRIPLMILDIDGPFGTGLVYGGASSYIDMMPEIKRTLSRLLMSVDELGEFDDYYFDLDNREWYRVRYQEGAFSNERVDRPRW